MDFWGLFELQLAGVVAFEITKGPDIPFHLIGQAIKLHLF